MPYKVKMMRTLWVRTTLVVVISLLATVCLSAPAWAAIAAAETVVGSMTTGDSFTLTSWTPGSNELVLLAVAVRDESIAVTASGNGLTFVQVADVDNTQGQGGITLFRAMGASPSTGSITVTMTGNLKPAMAIATRFSGVDTSGTHGSGAVEASATNVGPGTDDDDMLQAVSTVTANAWAVAAGWGRSQAFTVPGGEAAVSSSPSSVNQTAGSGGDITRCSVWYEGPVATPASTQLGAANDLAAAGDWAMIVVSVKPAATNSAPTAPTTPYANDDTAQSGQTNPTGLTDPTPAFSAIYNDSDGGDIANKYRVEVNTASNFSGTVMWDSGASGTSMTNTTAGNRSPDIIYAGSALSNSTTYYWRIKFWDDDGAEGTVSATQNFATGTLVTSALRLEGSALQLEGSALQFEGGP